MGSIGSPAMKKVFLCFRSSGVLTSKPLLMMCAMPTSPQPSTLNPWASNAASSFERMPFLALSSFPQSR